MDFRKLFEDYLASQPSNVTVKTIRGKHYLYEQTRQGSKVISKFLKVAPENYTPGNKKKLALIKWFLKNETRVMETIAFAVELNRIKKSN